MSDSRSDLLKAAREEFKESIPIAKADSEEGSSYQAKFVIIKKKNSQSGNTVTNSVTIQDQVTEVKYVVSVNAQLLGQNSDISTLLGLQEKIADFLLSLPKEL